VVCSFNSPVNLQTASRINVADAPSTGILTQQVLGGGELEKSGDGLLKLTSANIYSGGTLVSDGALAVNNTSGSGVGAGDVAVNGAILGGSGTLGAVGDASNVTLTGGTLAPGNLTGTLGATLPLPQLPNLNTSPGVLSILGSLSFDSAAALHIDLTGSAVGTQYDQVVSNGSISLGGATLNFALGDFVPVGNETFTLVNNTGVGAINGEFGNYTQGAMVDLAGKTFFINYQGGAGGNDVVLSPTAPGIENANFDGDGDVDGNDFLIWQRGFGGPGTASQGDANADGQVNDVDFGIWKNQFGTTGLAAPAVGAVPEPTAVAMLLGAAGAALLGRRRWASCN
jgi:autotransporter-associated beta strand protein